MRFGSYPRLMALALAVPQLSYALGLGTMRIESGLNQPLSAQIDIIGASPEDLATLSARLASAEVFQRYEAERPPFMSTTTMTVGTDAQGRPVLNIKSSDAFTEPLLNLLIDLHWGQREELIRSYPLLLDPVPTSRAAPAPAPLPSPAPATAPSASLAYPAMDALLEPVAIEIPKITLPSFAVDGDSPPQVNAGPAAPGTEHRVVAHETLGSIARQAGARSAVEQQRTMVAIFRANPDSFAGNMNRLHLGALLKIPPADAIQAISAAEAEREIHTQMDAWRAYQSPAAPSGSWSTLSTAAIPAPAAPAAAPMPRAAAAEQTKVLSAVNKLDGQVQFLQQTLGETNRELASANARIREFERHAAPSASAPANLAATRMEASTGKSSVSVMALVLTLLAGGVAYGVRFLPVRSQRPKPQHEEVPTVEAPALDPGVIEEVAMGSAEFVTAESSPAHEPQDSTEEFEPTDQQILEGSSTIEMTQVTEIDLNDEETAQVQAVDDPDTVVLVSLDNSDIQHTSAQLDYNLAELDDGPQHVEMPDTLREKAMFVERRKNVVDSLMAALKKDPTRLDLRMKLLETLHTSAAKNLRAFKDVVRDMARHPERVGSAEWEHIMAMGREIAAGDPLFPEGSSESESEQKVANA